MDTRIFDDLSTLTLFLPGVLLTVEVSEYADDVVDDADTSDVLD